MVLVTYRSRPDVGIPTTRKRSSVPVIPVPEERAWENPSNSWKSSRSTRCSRLVRILGDLSGGHLYQGLILRVGSAYFHRKGFAVFPESRIYRMILRPRLETEVKMPDNVALQFGKLNFYLVQPGRIGRAGRLRPSLSIVSAASSLPPRSAAGAVYIERRRQSNRAVGAARAFADESPRRHERRKAAARAELRLRAQGLLPPRSGGPAARAERGSVKLS
jgi:hypothetical protein